MKDLTYMRMTLKLAGKGSHRVFPNPMVGCVIVNKGKIVGKGFHEYFGGPHAEINALSNAGNRAFGATLYVNLEPCNHWGKTPPCTHSIIKSGIKRVVASMTDPNPEIKEMGFKELTRSGIEVTKGIMKKQAKKLNSQYIKSLRKRKSYVIVKTAISLDGKIASKTGDSKWISSDKSREYVHKLRSEVDAVLVGVHTIIRDNPELTSHGKGKNPIRVIIDPNLRIPLKSKILRDSFPRVLIYSSKKLKEKLEVLRKKCIILIYLPKKGRVINFKYIIKKLATLSIYRILIEGGGETIANALRSGVVNELICFVAPIIIGGRDAPTFVEGEGISRVYNAIKISGLKVRKSGNDLMITGKIK